MLLEASIEEAGYPGGFKVRNIHLELSEGEVVVITGRSGSGKTTLVRAITNTIEIQGGFLHGEVYIKGRSIREYNPWELAKRLAYIPQEPWYGIIGYTVGSEFCYTQLITSGVCDMRVLGEAGFNGREDFITYGLSAGQTQLLLWAEALATGAEVVVMDEPFVYLDEENRSKLLGFVGRMIREGRGLIIVDHNPSHWRSLNPRLLVLEKGSVVYDGDASDWRVEVPETTVKSGRKGRVAVEARDIWFKYPGYSWVLKGVSFMVEEGGLTAVVGGNGSGKTTLLKIVGGLLKPTRGRVFIGGRAIYIPENPLAYYSMPTPREELMYMARGDESKFLEVVELFDLRGILDSKLSNLSSGERRRLAIASAYLGGFDIYLLDEPTGGLDAYNVARVLEAVQRLLDDGKTVIAASHDSRLTGATDRIFLGGGGS